MWPPLDLIPYTSATSHTYTFILQIVHLKKNRALLSPYVAMGTAEVKGEDNEAKGAVYLFEVAHLEVRIPLITLFVLTRFAATKRPGRRAFPPQTTVSKRDVLQFVCQASSAL